MGETTIEHVKAMDINYEQLRIIMRYAECEVKKAMLHRAGGGAGT